jgi:hypothetical protein
MFFDGRLIVAGFGGSSGSPAVERVHVDRVRAGLAD